MQLAVKLASNCLKYDEVPVGAVIIKENKVISAQYNKTEQNFDLTAHAEILCIREVTKKLSSNFLNECDIYTTLEPCAMCAQALAWARIKRIYFAAFDEKFGAVSSNFHIFDASSVNYKPEIYGGIMEKESVQLLKEFFSRKRKNI